MPTEFTDCVSALKKQGKSNDSAYAICTAQYIDKHGKSPFANEVSITALPVQENTKRSIIDMIEKCGKGKKIKVHKEVTQQGS